MTTHVRSRHEVAQWLDHMQSIHSRSVDMTLDRVCDVLGRMSLLEPAHGVISVAGTNGKGSSVAMLEAVLRTAGYRVGAYTSPHLVRYNERVQVDGRPIDDETLCASFERVERARGEIPLTYFEFGTAAALHVFGEAGLDVAVLEIGMGGRLDAVNALDADVCLITSIGIDHTDWLGPDRETIAREKAGIMRAARPVVCSDPTPPQVIAGQAALSGARLLQLGVDFHYRGERDSWVWWTERSEEHRLPYPALGQGVQVQNAAGVIAVLDSVRDRWPVSWSDIGRGLEGARLPGRIHMLPGAPIRVLDVGHNPDAVRLLRDALVHHPVSGRNVAVMGMLADKQIDAAVDLLAAQIDCWHLASLDVPRGATAARLAEAVRRRAGDVRVVLHDGPVRAYRAAMAECGPPDRVVIFGSFYLVGDILRELN